MTGAVAEVSGVRRRIEMSSGAITRRSFVQSSTWMMFGSRLVRGRPAAHLLQGAPLSYRRLRSVNALVFDVFGTVVDWRSSIIDEVEQMARLRGLSVDAAKFADAWRAGYGPAMNRVRT